MDRFVRDLLALPPLDAAEEVALARLAREGDPAAREALITAGMRAVAMRARSRGLSGEDLRDAVQSGAVGLIRAVDRFDPDRGARLTTYAWHWIGASMRVAPRREVPLDTWHHDRPASSHAESGREAADLDLLDGMPGHLADVLRLRFGIGPSFSSPASRRAVAEQLGLTAGQVRAIEAKAMRHLRRRLGKVIDRAPLVGGADPL